MVTKNKKKEIPTFFYIFQKWTKINVQNYISPKLLGFSLKNLNISLSIFYNLLFKKEEK
jgi:hypothetical protein